jgi:hypothetical protein
MESTDFHAGTKHDRAIPIENRHLSGPSSSTQNFRPGVEKLPEVVMKMLFWK